MSRVICSTSIDVYTTSLHFPSTGGCLLIHVWILLSSGGESSTTATTIRMLHVHENAAEWDGTALLCEGGEERIHPPVGTHFCMSSQEHRHILPQKHGLQQDRARLEHWHARGELSDGISAEKPCRLHAGLSALPHPPLVETSLLVPEDILERLRFENPTTNRRTGTPARGMGRPKNVLPGEMANHPIVSHGLRASTAGHHGRQ